MCVTFPIGPNRPGAPAFQNRCPVGWAAAIIQFPIVIPRRRRRVAIFRREIPQ